MSFAVFLDRDGTIVADRHFLADPEGLELLPNAAEGLRRMRALGARLVLVTNQSGVARGYFELSDVERTHERLRQLLGQEGVVLDAIYVCPHGPNEGCDCRKPGPGLLLRAAEELGIDLSRSIVIGDKESDIEAGRRVGAATIRIGPARVNASNSPAAAADLVQAAGILTKWTSKPRSRHSPARSTSS